MLKSGLMRIMQSVFSVGDLSSLTEVKVVIIRVAII